MLRNKKSLTSNTIISKRKKIRLALMVFTILFIISLTTYLPVIDFFDEWLYLDFSHLMFLFGITLGLFYYVLCLLKYFFANKCKSGVVNFIIASLPSIYLLNCFVWYFYLFFNKLFSETKNDAAYYQTVMIAFSIYFLTVKIGKEFGQLNKMIQN